MFIGHLGLGLAAKQFTPRVSLAVLLLAAQFADVLWPVFVATGLEVVRIDPGNTRFTALDFVGYPYSHSLAALVVWGLLFGFAYRFRHREPRTMPVLAALVVSHWLLDFVTHRPDMPLVPGGRRFGLGLWNSIPGTVAVELPLYLGGVWMYVNATRARDRIGRWAFFGLAVFLIPIYFANIGTAPPTVTALWIAALIGGGGLTLWSWWADRHRLVIWSVALAGLVLPASASAQQVEIAASVAFTEGPTVDRDGSVYFTDIVSQRIMKLGADGMLSIFREKSNVANGLLLDQNGGLIACEGGEFERGGVKLKGIGRVTRTDLRTGKIEVLADRFDGKPLQGPNDVTMDGKGRLYFTDMQGVAVYRIDAPGKIARILAAPDIERPNGIQISPDDKTLYLIEANGGAGGARMIRAYDLLPDGTVRNMRVHFNFSPGRSADGMSVDSRGNLYAAAGLHRLRGTAETLDTKCGVYVISPEGKLLQFIPIDEDTITNTAFGGPDMRTLYVTAGKTLYRIRTDIPGLPR